MNNILPQVIIFLIIFTAVENSFAGNYQYHQDELDSYFPPENHGCDNPDADGDNHASIMCGGDDCDDFDGNRFPSNPEVCDDFWHDEDCNPSTIGTLDVDGDGYVDRKCGNYEEFNFPGKAEQIEERRRAEELHRYHHTRLREEWDRRSPQRQERAAAKWEEWREMVNQQPGESYREWTARTRRLGRRDGESFENWVERVRMDGSFLNF